MSGLRDYDAWHRRYDDPESDLSWRLRAVQGHIRRALDERPGPVRVVSACAGDGRDVLEVLAERPDAERVTATLIEIHPGIAERARRGAAGLEARVEVRVADAGHSDAYARAVPADVVLLVGILGNLSPADMERTLRTAPQLCAPGSDLIWTRARDIGDRNDIVRATLTDAGFTELGYATLDAGSLPAVGAMRYDGAPRPLVAGRRIFTFRR
jgi:hypothetical protein